MFCLEPAAPATTWVKARCPISSNPLYLARGCPNLKSIVWENDQPDPNPEDPDDMYGQVTPERDLANIKSLVRLLARRGGSLDSDVSGVEELLRYAE